MSETLHGHRTVLARGDLQPDNIIVTRSPEVAGGCSSESRIVVIDWEISGWSPEYWEFCNSVIGGRRHSDWLGAAQRIMLLYAKEYLMLEKISQHIFLLGIV